MVLILFAAWSGLQQHVVDEAVGQWLGRLCTRLGTVRRRFVCGLYPWSESGFLKTSVFCLAFDASGLGLCFTLLIFTDHAEATDCIVFI